MTDIENILNKEQELLKITEKRTELAKEIADLEKDTASNNAEDIKKKREELRIQNLLFNSQKDELKILKDKVETEKQHKKEQESIFQFILDQNEQLKEQETAITKISKIYETYGKQIEATVKHIKDYTTFVNNINLSRLNPKEAHKTIIDMEKSTAQLGIRAGQGSAGVKELTANFIYLQSATGESAERSREIVEILSRKGYVENIKEASVAVSLFGRATGASAQSTTDMLNELTKVAKFTSRESANVLANITKVQHANGITSEGINSLIGGIKTITTNMKTFGQTDESIKRMTKSTAELVSGMEKVGVAAKDAVGWVERLTDPEKIEKNIGLYAQLGMSISDALSGNIDTSIIGEGMKEFGQKIKEMGPIAGKAYADAFNVSYKDAIKAADFEGPNVEEVETDKTFEALNAMKEATLDASNAMQENINKISGSLQTLNKDLLRGLNAFQFSMKTIFLSLMSFMGAQTNNKVKGMQSYVNASIEEINKKTIQLRQDIQSDRNLTDSERNRKLELLDREAKAAMDKLANELRKFSPAAAKSLDRESRKMRNSIEAGGRRTANNLDASLTEGANKLRNATNSMGNNIGKFSMAFSALTMVLNAIVGIINKFNLGQKLGDNKYTKFFAGLLGINTSLETAINNNTEAVLSNTEATKNESTPERIFLKSNGRSAVTSGQIISSNTVTTNTIANTNTNTTTNTIKHNNENISLLTSEVRQSNSLLQRIAEATENTAKDIKNKEASYTTINNESKEQSSDKGVDSNNG